MDVLVRGVLLSDMACLFGPFLHTDLDHPRDAQWRPSRCTWNSFGWVMNRNQPPLADLFVLIRRCHPEVDPKSYSKTHQHVSLVDFQKPLRRRPKAAVWSVWVQSGNRYLRMGAARYLRTRCRTLRTAPGCHIDRTAPGGFKGQCTQARPPWDWRIELHWGG